MDALERDYALSEPADTHIELASFGTRAPQVKRMPAPDIEIMRAVIEASPDCIKVIELDGTVSFMNANGCRSMEIENWDAIVGQPWVEMWPAAAQNEASQALAQAAQGREARFESYCPSAKGAPRWWDVSVTPVRGEDGAVERFVSVCRDVTERIHRENRLRLHEIELNDLASEQAAMLREKTAEMEASDELVRAVDHRMKNSLAMLGSLLKMETRRVSDEAAKATLKAAAARVSMIASVHEQLHRGTEKDALSLQPYLSALVRDLVSSMLSGPEGPGIHAEVSSDDLVMRGGKALALGLATVELVMNAIKHARPGAGCSIDVRCIRIGNMMQLTITDDGEGLPADFDPAVSVGLGMRVVQSSLSKLEGKMTYANNANGGAVFTIVWPI